MFKLLTLLLVISSLFVIVIITDEVSSTTTTISLQRCNSSNCNPSNTCETIRQFESGKCGPPLLKPSATDKSEILECKNSSETHSCFVETIYNKSSSRCETKNLVAKLFREFGVCTQYEPFGNPLMYFMYELNNNNSPNGGPDDDVVTMYRGCHDSKCQNCEVVAPVRWNTCTDFPDQTTFFRNWTFEISNFQKSCAVEVKRSVFSSENCEGAPNLQEHIFTDQCYDLEGFHHRFICSNF